MSRHSEAVCDQAAGMKRTHEGHKGNEEQSRLYICRLRITSMRTF